MGIAFKDLFESNEIRLDDLRGKVLVVDSFNMMYQFLTTIRGRDGSLFTDSNGNVTSHLIGLFGRVSKMLEKDLKLAFVFDGKPPELKKQETQRRKALKAEAEKKYYEAMRKKDITDMKKFASRTTKLNEEMINDAKELITAFGLPIIEAPSEGEAQAAYMIEKGDGYAVLSQDFDSLVQGASKLVRNLSISGKRKSTSKLKYETVKPELINLADNLNRLGIDRNQLIAMGMLVGTDYNPGGIKGIGPANALKLVKQHGESFDNLFASINWNDYFDIDWEEVYYLFKKMPKTDDYNLSWNNVNFDEIEEFLIEKHNFAEVRVSKTLEKIRKNNKQKQQKGLGEFF